MLHTCAKAEEGTRALFLHGQRTSESQSLARGIGDAQQELPVRLGVFRRPRGLAHLDQYRVLTGAEMHTEAMPVEPHAVAILLETEYSLAIDPHCQVVVG